MNTKKFEIEVTQLKISKPFLKIFARNLTKKNISALDQLKDLFVNAPKVDIKVGDVCVAFVASPSKYERVRVLQINSIEKTASLLHIDGGYHGIYSLSRVKSITN